MLRYWNLLAKFKSAFQAIDIERTFLQTFLKLQINLNIPIM